MIHKTLASLALGLFLVSSALAAPEASCCDAAKCKSACCKVACCDAPCCPPAKVRAMGLAKKAVLKAKTPSKKAGGCCSMPCCNGGACCAVGE